MIETYLPHNLLYGGSIVCLALTFNGVAKDTGMEIGVINFTTLKHLLPCMYNMHTLELCKRTLSYIQ